MPGSTASTGWRDYSIMSNMMSTFTDCPGREKLAYPADYLQPFGTLHRHFGLDAYLRTMQRHLVEGQSRAGDNIGNVALKAPVYDWGYLGRFGDEINWGDGIILVPWLLYETYGDTQTMARYYPQMQAFLNYISTQKAGTGANAFIVDAALADWAAADQTTSGPDHRHVGLPPDRRPDGQDGRPDRTRRRRDRVPRARAQHRAGVQHGVLQLGAWPIHERRESRHRRRDAGGAGPRLEEGLVPDGERQRVLDALVELINGYQPFGGGPHLSGGTIGLQSTVRALIDGGRDDVLWDVLQEDTRPSYGFFMLPTTANPGGLTTIPEYWDMHDSKNHMILSQIDEWFTSGLAGIRQARGSVGYRKLVIDPRIAGDLTHVDGSYETPYGEVASEWTRKHAVFRLEVKVPPNTTAEVRVPTGGRKADRAPKDATFVGIEDDRAVYRVSSGSYEFTARDAHRNR